MYLAPKSLETAEGWLTPRQAAARVGLNVNTVRLWIERGHLPARVTPGGYYRINPDDLPRLMQPGALP